MKKLTSLLLAGLALFSISCSNADKGAAASANNQAAEPREATSNVRYVSQDSILKYYVFADAVTQKNQELQTNLLTYGNQLQSQAQKIQSDFQQKLQNNGFLTEKLAQDEYNKIQQKLASYDKQLNQRQAEVQAQALANVQALNDSIKNFIIDFNKNYNYDAILYTEPCIYVNPALDITEQVIEGLNARYQVPVENSKK